MQHTNDAHTQPLLVEDNEFSLIDALNFIINGWKSISCASVIGLIVGISCNDPPKVAQVKLLTGSC